MGTESLSEAVAGMLLRGRVEEILRGVVSCIEGRPKAATPEQWEAGVRHALHEVRASADEIEALLTPPKGGA